MVNFKRHKNKKFHAPYMSNEHNEINDYGVYWSLPPLIGEINNFNIKIIFEPQSKEEITCKINKKEKNNVVEYWVNIKPNENMLTQKIFEFCNEGYYIIEWFQKDLLIYKNEIMLTDDPSFLIFVSCDLIEGEVSDSIWKKIENFLKDNQSSHISDPKLSYMFHIGDQAYMNKVYDKSFKLIRNKGHCFETEKEIINLFNERYKKTWKSHHNILSQTSNYNIWDDNQLTNNFFIGPTSTYEESLYFNYIKNLSKLSYLLFQDSQHIHKNKFITEFSWIKTMGHHKEIVVIAIERTTNIIPIDFLIHQLTNLILLNNFKKIILCFASAPIPTPGGFYGTIYKKICYDALEEGTRRFWSNLEIFMLYNFLFELIEKKFVQEIVVVGGDLFLGFTGFIQRNTTKIPVAISSPVTAQPGLDSWIASKAIKSQSGSVISLKDDNFINLYHNYDPIIFNVITSKARRCFVTIDLSKSPIKPNITYSKSILPKNKISFLKFVFSSR